MFWDEFDTDDLIWLKAFLAPMQDGEFQAEGAKHPLGRAIFVFAGGTAPSFELFDRTNAGGKAEKRFRSAKGLDFVSRLRGYVNLKGPNPVPATTEPRQPYQETDSSEGWTGTGQQQAAPPDPAREDPAHLIGRQ